MSLRPGQEDEEDRDAAARGRLFFQEQELWQQQDEDGQW